MTDFPLPQNGAEAEGRMVPRQDVAAMPKPQIKAGATLAALVPTNFDEVTRLARLGVMSGLLTREKTRVRSDDGQWVETEETDDAVLARGTMIILQGLEIGMPPMQALQLIAKIGKRLSVHSEGVPALLWARGFKLREWEVGTGDERTAHCEITRPDGTKIERTFSVAQAKKARLWSPNDRIQKRGKGGSTYEADNDSTWHRFDFRMLMHRARGYAANDGAPDVLRGTAVREIIEDADYLDVTPVDEPVRQVLSPPSPPPAPTVEAKAPAPPPAPEETAPVSEHPTVLFRRTVGESMAACKDLDALNEVFASNEDWAGEINLSRDLREMYDMHESRIEKL